MEHGVEAWGPMDPKEGPAIEPVETLPFYRHSGDKGDSPEVSCACGRVTAVLVTAASRINLSWASLCRACLVPNVSPSGAGLHRYVSSV